MKKYTYFLKDVESLTTYNNGWVLWCSPIVCIRP